VPWRPVPDATEVGDVYVLHFHAPIGPPHQQARHYIGWARNTTRRVEHHRRGTAGVVLTTLAKRLGIGFEVAQVIPNCTRADERRFKNRGGGSRVCAICREAKQLRKRLRIEEVMQLAEMVRLCDAA
jgi:hypothetical protein